MSTRRCHRQRPARRGNGSAGCVVGGPVAKTRMGGSSKSTATAMTGPSRFRFVRRRPATQRQRGFVAGPDEHDDDEVVVHACRNASVQASWGVDERGDRRGGRDRAIPVAHTVQAHDRLPGGLESSRTPGTSRTPSSPLRFSRLLRDFVDSTAPPRPTVRRCAGGSLGSSRGPPSP